MTLSEIAENLREASPPLYWATVGHLVVLPILLLLLATDDHEILGISAWIKPLKFFVSAMIFMATTAFLIRELHAPRGSTAIGWIVAVAMVVENLLICLQSFRGARSHFNNDSTLDSLIFVAMGLFIVANTVAMAWLLVVSLQAHVPSGVAYLWGIRLGIAVFLLGSLQSGLMLRLGAHTVGAADGGPGLPLLNWSTRFGDLRIGHFLGLHALQILPLTGWFIDRMALPNPGVAIWIAAVAYALLAGLVTLQALAGKPLIF